MSVIGLYTYVCMWSNNVHLQIFPWVGLLLLVVLFTYSVVGMQVHVYMPIYISTVCWFLYIYETMWYVTYYRCLGQLRELPLKPQRSFQAATSPNTITLPIFLKHCWSWSGRSWFSPDSAPISPPCVVCVVWTSTFSYHYLHALRRRFSS